MEWIVWQAEVVVVCCGGVALCLWVVVVCYVGLLQRVCSPVSVLSVVGLGALSCSFLFSALVYSLLLLSWRVLL